MILAYSLSQADIELSQKAFKNILDNEKLSELAKKAALQSIDEMGIRQPIFTGSKIKKKIKSE